MAESLAVAERPMEINERGHVLELLAQSWLRQLIEATDDWVEADLTVEEANRVMSRSNWLYQQGERPDPTPARNGEIRS